MDKQVIVAIGREFGTDGHRIAELLAEKLNLPLYDRNLLDEFADQNDLDASLLQKYDEKPRFKFGSRTVRGYSNSPIDNVAEIQSALIKGKALDDDSFIIIGRCAEEVLKDFPCLISIFIWADKDVKIKHTMEKFEITEKEAIKKIRRHDKYRSMYHDHFSEKKWGDSRTYDLCINSSKLGTEGTAEFLADYVRNRAK